MVNIKLTNHFIKWVFPNNNNDFKLKYNELPYVFLILPLNVVILVIIVIFCIVLLETSDVLNGPTHLLASELLQPRIYEHIKYKSKYVQKLVV